MRSKIKPGERIRSVEKFEGLRITTVDGRGEDDSPVREIVWYYDENCNLLVVDDVCESEASDV